MFPVCDPEDLRVSLPSNESWSDVIMTADGLRMFTFSGGNVTFNGISYGSVATYTTTEDYHINGEHTFQRFCQNAWIPPARITFTSNDKFSNYV